MKYEFEVGYDRITNFDAPGYTNKEISTFLTKAQEEFTLDLIRNGDFYKEDFKKSLNMLKSYTEITTNINSGNYPNSYTVNLPIDTMHVHNDRLNITTTSNHFYPSTSINDVEVKPVDDDYYHANKLNPFKKPSINLAWRLDDSYQTNKRHIYVIEPNITISKVCLHYYKKPAPIIVVDAGYIAGDGTIDGLSWTSYTAASLDCALDPITHREIVDRAVKLAYAAVQDQTGFQISAAQEQDKNVK